MTDRIDRRGEYAALKTQLNLLEEHVHQRMTPELVANTRLTKQVHEALMGRDDAPGISTKVEEMHEAFASAKGGLKALETMGRVAKPVALVLGLVAAVFTFVHTGTWSGPK